MSMRRAGAGLLVATAALGLSGCLAVGDSTPDPANAPSPPSSSAPSDVPMQDAAGAQARAVLAGARTLGGEPVRAETLAGRPVLLWFWAPWCTICRGEAPDVVEVASELADDGSAILVLGVPGRGDEPSMRDFVSDTRTGGLTHVIDADGSIWRHFGVLTQPAFALLDVDGGVHVINGALGARNLRDAAERLEVG